MRYVFDISDTGGKKSILTWELDRNTMKAYAAWLRDKEGIARTGEKESDKSFLKVFTRCGFDLPTEKQDFSFITAFTKEEEVYRLGSLLSDISCEVLRGIANDLKQVAERSIANGRDNNDVSRGSGRDAVPGSHGAGGNGEHDKLREVRSEGDGVPEREPQRQIPDIKEVRETGGEDAGSGGRGEPDDGRAGGQLPEKQPAEGQKLDNGDVAVTSAGEDAGRGNRDERNRNEVPLEGSGQQTEDSEQQNIRKAEI